MTQPLLRKKETHEVRSGDRGGSPAETKPRVLEVKMEIPFPQTLVCPYVFLHLEPQHARLAMKRVVAEALLTVVRLVAVNMKSPWVPPADAVRQSKVHFQWVSALFPRSGNSMH